MKYQQGIDKFDGGLNTKAQPLNIPLKQLAVADGMWFDDYGAVETVGGVATLNSDSLAAGIVDGLFSYKPSTMSAQLVAVCNGRAAVATGAATAFNDIASSVTVWTAETPVEMVQQNELLFFSNGYVKPYKFNGTEFTQMGVSAPSTVLTAATNATAGNLTGFYTWVYTGVNSYLAEGDYGSATVTFTAVGESVVVGSLPTAPVSAGIEYWKIYRNTAGVEGAYWYVTDVSNGVTSFTDDVADSDLVTLAPTDQGTPRFYKYMLPAAGRMWGAGDGTKDYLWFSNINQPEEFPALNYIRVGRGDGLDISGIAELNGNIVISKSDFSGRTAVYELSLGDPTNNSDPSNWYLKKTGEDIGSDSHRAMVRYGNHITMLNHQGIFAYTNGGNQVVITESQQGASLSENISDLIEPDILALPGEYLHLAAAVNWEQKIWFCVPEATKTNNAQIYYFDFINMNKSEAITGAWSVAPRKFEFAFGQMVKHENGLYGCYVGDTVGFYGTVFELDSSTRAGSYPQRMRTAPFQGKKGHEQNWKDFRWVFITHDIAAYSVTVSWYVDGVLISDTSMSLAASGSETTKVSKVRLGAAQGRYLQIEISNNDFSEPITIRKIELVYNLRGLRN